MPGGAFSTITRDPVGLDLIETVDRVVVLDEARVVCDDRPEVSIPFYERLMA